MIVQQTNIILVGLLDWLRAVPITPSARSAQGAKVCTLLQVVAWQSSSRPQDVMASAGRAPIESLIQVDDGHKLIDNAFYPQA